MDICTHRKKISNYSLQIALYNAPLYQDWAFKTDDFSYFCSTWRLYWPGMER